ncbi:right-handed parallel beta-helix repeat-containing protein [Luteibacter sp. 329MFSha]|uniref:right-handed parallel beta-helix repeat-containing protein n=1 Tax=Luteibacter sp. 329MFSha TaxID=1798239 RepID=UPI0008D39BEC|nr:right-handed parallel beta-helix repeat-containing protein [Luteibacter sp. 329MFSha]SEV93184.1 Right handed beta helix region [Luteibacter sp. 329MFSha]
MRRRAFLGHALLGTGALAVLPTSALAAPDGSRYYVDASSGDDAHDGRGPGTAWRTLERVNRQRFAPGDTLLFRRGGDYPGVFHPTGSGRAGAPIVVDAYGDGEAPHLHADGVSPATVRLENVEYWTLRHLAVSNKGPQAGPRRTGVHLLHHDFGTVHGIVLEGLHVHDVNGSPIKKDGGGSAILVEAGGKQRPTHHEGLTIADNVIERSQRDGILFLGAGSRAAGLAMGVVVRGNRISEVPGDCILVKGCRGALVERNTVGRCGPLPRGEAAAGIWPFDCDDTLIQYNEVSDHRAYADGQGFDADFHCRNTIIQYNYSHDNAGGMALVCNDGRDAGGIGNVGTIVRFNVSINDGLRSSGSAALRISGPVTGARIYNNIIIIPEKKAGVEVTAFRATSWKGVPDDTAIHDNIVMAFRDPAMDMRLATRTSMAGNQIVAEGTHPQARAMLGRVGSKRPTLAQVNALVKACFADGKPVANAADVIAKLV